MYHSIYDIIKKDQIIENKLNRIGSTYRLKTPKYLLEKLKTWKDGKITVICKVEDNVVRMRNISQFEQQIQSKIHGNLSCHYAETDYLNLKLHQDMQTGPEEPERLLRRTKMEDSTL